MVDAVTVRNDGMAEMAYVGEKPWHGLGQQLETGASIDTWKKQAGMDWTIEKSPLMFLPAGKQKPREVPNRNVLYRGDTAEPLGEVSDHYKVVQPDEVLEFFRDLTENAGFELNTAGTLFGGKRFWALARVGDSTEIVKGDQVDSFLLLATSCDGSLATTAQFTTVRVVCNNTLTMSLAGSRSDTVRVSHRSAFDPQAAKDQLGIVHDKFDEFSTAAKQLAKMKITKKKAEAFVIELLQDHRVIASKEPAGAKAVKQIMDLHEGQALGADIAGIQGTGWGLLNAVTEYVDHRATSKTDAHRLSNAWFGRGDTMKTDAFRRLLEVA